MPRFLFVIGLTKMTNRNILALQTQISECMFKSPLNINANWLRQHGLQTTQGP